MSRVLWSWSCGKLVALVDSSFFFPSRSDRNEIHVIKCLLRRATSQSRSTRSVERNPRLYLLSGEFCLVDVLLHS